MKRTYKGVLIEFLPKLLTDGKWAANFKLVEQRDPKGIRSETSFESEPSYDTQEMANERAIQVARHEINNMLYLRDLTESAAKDTI